MKLFLLRDERLFKLETDEEATLEEIVAWLKGHDTDGWLEREPPGCVYRFQLAGSLSVVRRSSSSARERSSRSARQPSEWISPYQRIGETSATDGDLIVITLDCQGAGTVGIPEIAAGLAAAKLTIDAANVGVGMYRARTERMSAELDRDRLAAEQREREDARAEGSGDATG